MSGESERQRSGKRTLDKKSRNLNPCLGSPTVVWWPLAPKNPFLEGTVSIHLLGRERSRIMRRWCSAGGGQVVPVRFFSLAEADRVMSVHSISYCPLILSKEIVVLKYDSILRKILIPIFIPIAVSLKDTVPAGLAKWQRVGSKQPLPP